MMMMMNCFCGMVDQREVVSLISRLDHGQKFSPLWISDMPGVGFEPVLSLGSRFNHFQIGRFGEDCCAATYSCRWDHYNLSKCWSLVKHAWKRWMKECLPRLNTSLKCFKTYRDFKLEILLWLWLSNDIAHEKWQYGRILEVYPGKGRHIRVIKVLVYDNELVRPISNLDLLECKLDIWKLNMII